MSASFHVPALRLQPKNAKEVRSEGKFILYWMIANRRTHHNFALDRALYWAETLERPLVVLEALRSGYPWASDRLHAFVIQGMQDNAARFAATPIRYYPYLEPKAGAGAGLLRALASEAAVVVTDEFPCFFLPRMVSRAAEQLSVRLEAVDSNGLLPLRAADRAFGRAFDFRRFLQKTLAEHLRVTPCADPLAQADLQRRAQIPRELTAKWAPAELGSADTPESLSRLPIDHTVPIAPLRGGEIAGREQARAFVEERLRDYTTQRNHPDHDGQSGLSPYLHFGHVSVHDVLALVADREGWTPDAVTSQKNGKREGWWGMSEASESFLDELVTWRELGFNFSSQRPDYDQYDSLPGWARETLEAHEADPREPLYSLEQLETASTHDQLWNAAQRELLEHGRIHNYLRMLWGKKILQWSPSPRDALAVMIHLNNKYALDGRNPNSYSGIFWCLGRFDRPWAPERPVLGKIRYMTSESAAKKLKLNQYLARFGGERQGRLF